MEVRLLHRAAVRRGLSLGEDAVDGAHVALRPLARGERVDGGVHLAQVVMMPVGNAGRLGGLEHLRAPLFGQLQLVAFSSKFQTNVVMPSSLSHG